MPLVAFTGLMMRLDKHMATVLHSLTASTTVSFALVSSINQVSLTVIPHNFGMQYMAQNLHDHVT